MSANFSSSWARQGVLQWLLTQTIAGPLETLEIVLDVDQMDMVLESMAQIQRGRRGDLVSMADCFGDLRGDDDEDEIL
jgi:hypothetical protein